jgi:alkanesulfonate monooxygenase SsuD/methylene tetrahydromethanopterin reductase-like flavin-dependent oxidoreductase (luciferase family)
MEMGKKNQDQVQTDPRDVDISDDGKWYSNGSRGYTIVGGGDQAARKIKAAKKGFQGKIISGEDRGR